MAQIIWSEAALDDVNDIAEYIALNNYNAAKKLVKTIFESTKRLKNFPESGRRPPEINSSRYGEIVVGPCRVFYRHDNPKVYILYVMRRERALRNFILEDRIGDGS
jgi:toxin ParE1/3/4